MKDLRQLSRTLRRELLRAQSLSLRFLADDSGQATTEYIMLVAAAVIGAAAITRGIAKTLDQGILHLGSTLEGDIKTGNAPLYVWDN